MSELWKPRIEFRGRSTFSAPPVAARPPPPVPKTSGTPLPPKKSSVEIPEGGIGFGQTRREAPLKSLRGRSRRRARKSKKARKYSRKH